MSLKIIFMGTPEFSIPTLEELNKAQHKIVCVYTQPSKKKSRGQKVVSSPVSLVAKKMNIEVRTPFDLNSIDEYNYIKDSKPDLVIVVAYGQIIPERILKLDNIKFINIHASLLPKWRGAAPIQRSIMNKDIETGITIMKIEKELDAGPYIKQEKVLIKKDTNSENLGKTLSDLGAKTLIKNLSSIMSDSEKFIDQNHKEATYAKKILKSETKIKWDENAIDIIAKINAFNPSPCAWFEYKGNRYRVWKATSDENKGKIGEVINEELCIGCADSSIKITELQKEGKSKMNFKDFLAGNKIPKGSIIK